MLLLKLIQSLKESVNLGFTDREVSGISNDSRKIKQGFIFVAIKGHKLDGHYYVHDAITRGAVAIVTERQVDIDPHIAQIVVKNGREALSILSGYFFGQPSRKIKTIGVTGTNGKTTTTYLIKSIIENAIRVAGCKLRVAGNPQPKDAYSETASQVGLIGTVEYIVGKNVFPAKETTPESVDLHDMLAQMASLNIGHVVMEVSSQSLVQYRTHDIEFHAATFTNLTPEHLDYHHNFSEYRAAKSRLFERLGSSSFAILNADDDSGRYFARNTKASVVWYGIKNSADIRCRIVSFLPDSTVISLSHGKKEIEIRLPLIGLHNVYNALAAAANGLVLGIDLETIKKGICSFNGVPGRLERVDCGQDFKVFIDYAHTANALEAVLQSLRQSKLNGERLLLVFGCGGDRDRGKRPEMGMVASRLADRFWITNDNPRSEDPAGIISEIKKGIESGNSYSVQPDRRLAIKEALTEAKRKDIVLVAGKGHETGQIIGDKVIQFSDREVVKEILTGL